MSLDESRFTFVPIEHAVVAPGGIIEHLKDRWWIVHPEKGVAFFEGKFAQCNSIEGITRRLAEGHPWAVVQFIPSVFRRIDLNDYV